LLSVTQSIANILLCDQTFYINLPLKSTLIFILPNGEDSLQQYHSVHFFPSCTHSLSPDQELANFLQPLFQIIVPLPFTTGGTAVLGFYHLITVSFPQVPIMLSDTSLGIRNARLRGWGYVYLVCVRPWVQFPKTHTYTLLYRFCSLSSLSFSSVITQLEVKPNHKKQEGSSDP
jgi:hypothetical protein